MRRQHSVNQGIALAELDASIKDALAHNARIQTHIQTSIPIYNVLHQMGIIENVLDWSYVLNT